MARIRSVHPGQWTDEDFVALSPMARLLTLAIRNECDDQGVFEWKPLTIKMRLLPADNVDVADLLRELEENNHVKKFETGGKTYGAVRNFRRFQSPKKPNAIHPLPADIGDYVGIRPPSRGTEAHSVDEIGEGRESEGSGSSEPVGNWSGKVSAEGEGIGIGEEKERSRKRAHSRGSRLPEDWSPSVDDLAFAKQEGLTGCDLDRETQKFRDYWIAKPGQTGVKTDWSATWRNWVRRSAEDRSASKSQVGKPHVERGYSNRLRAMEAGQ